jgi:predicted protein tyrosine phosphatase
MRSFIPPSFHGTRNQLSNTSNRYQGNQKRILCVCSAGLLRSPTIADHLAALGYNTRACGVSFEYALIPISEALLNWADAIVVVSEQEEVVKSLLEHCNLPTDDVFSLNIADVYQRNDPQLIEEIKAQLAQVDFFNQV